MKILVTSSEPNLNGKTEKRFGHAKYFILIDTNSMEFQAIPNAIDGQNQVTIADILNMHLDAIVTGNIGPGSFETLNQAHIPVYVVRNKTVKEVVELLNSGELKPIEEPTMKNSPHDGGGFGTGHEHDQHPTGQGMGRGLGRGMGQGRGMGLGRGRGLGRGMGEGRGMGGGRRRNK